VTGESLIGSPFALSCWLQPACHLRVLTKMSDVGTMSDVDKPLTPTIHRIAISGVSHKAAGGPASSLADNRCYTVQSPARRERVLSCADGTLRPAENICVRIGLHQIQTLAIEPGLEFLRKPGLQKRQIVSLEAFHDPLHQHAVISITDDDPGDRSLSQLSNC
jgi:hypothetical protein